MKNSTLSNVTVPTPKKLHRVPSLLIKLMAICCVLSATFAIIYFPYVTLNQMNLEPLPWWTTYLLTVGFALTVLVRTGILIESRYRTNDLSTKELE